MDVSHSLYRAKVGLAPGFLTFHVAGGFDSPATLRCRHSLNRHGNALILLARPPHLRTPLLKGALAAGRRT